MPGEAQLAILFADVCGSTKLYETLGDMKARDTIARCITLMTEATEHHGGRVIKTIGDEVMSTFESADAAADAASEMQESITEGLVVNGNAIAIRVGFHFGPALLENNDVFGDAVNTAARMAGQSKAGQILTTSITMKQMSPIWQASTRQIDRATVKGKRDEIDMIEVMWQREDVTRMSTVTWDSAPEPKKLSLRLRYRGQELEVNEGQPAVSMGRAEGNELVVKHNLISRLHARIELRRGNFILTDQSINGTFVRTESGEEVFVRRDNVPIKGKGVIGLGQSVSQDSEDAVHFEADA